MTDEELKALVASLAIAQKEIIAAQKETDKQLKETDKQLKKTDKQLKELGQQIGGLGRKFGSFTEGMAFPSMKRILRERFGMNIIAPNVQVRKNGKSLELDVFAYSNGERKAAYIVEVKSHLKEEGLQQMLDILNDFPEFFADHADKQLYGILAAVNIPDNMRIKVLKSGIYLANIHDEHFELQVPEDFKARNFQATH